MVNTVWSTLDLNKEEKELQKIYANKIVESIFKRTKNIKDRRILFDSASNLSLRIWFEVADYHIKNRNKNKNEI